MFALIEEIDKVSESTDAFSSIELRVMEAPCIVNGGRFIYLDESGLLFVVFRIGTNVLLTGLVPTLYQIDIVSHL